MKKRFFVSFFILGLVSIIAQVLVLRELMVTFYGNEFFLGLALGCWLFWTAAGSFLGKKFISQKAFMANLIFLFFLFPLSLIFTRLIKTFFPFGVMIDFTKASFLTFLLIGPLGFCLGFFFTTAFFDTKKKLSILASRAYMVETLGFAAGGLLFNFWLVKFSPLTLSLILSLTLTLLAFFFTKRKIFLVPLLLLLVLAFLESPFWEQEILSLQFPGLVETKNSIYGRITVTKQGSQFNFFESGTLTGISQKTEDAEYLIHPILLQHHSPQKILMIGGGLNGGLAEILKHQPEKIDYLEIDPALVETVKKYLTADLAEVLDNPKVNLVFTDPRRYLKETSQKYDLVILNLPPPLTALINRLHTQEAFSEIKKILLPNGIIAINFSLPTDYLSPQAKNLSGSISQTLKQEFSQIMILPEYTLLFLASDQKVLTSKPDVLVQRLNARQIETNFVTSQYLNHRLTDDRIQMFNQELEKAKWPKNTDFHPIVYFYQTTFWQSYFSSSLANFFSKLPKAGPVLLLSILSGFSILLIKHRQSLPLFILALAGATIMIWEVILIFAFQVKLGYIYQKISLLLATLLMGMAIGNWIGQHLNFKKHLKTIILLMILFSLCLPTILTKATNQIMFFTLACLAGGLGGSVFPLIAQAYLKNKKQVGILYAGDLIGSFSGAILATLFLIPIFGLTATSYFLAIPFLAIILSQKLGR